MLDLLIIGSGISALSVANKAHEIGIQNIQICTKENPTSALSCMAQGGINGYMENNKLDSISLHIKDTLKASGGLGNRQVVEYLCKNAKESIKWLDNLGVSFNKDENGEFCQRKLAGSSFARACYAEDYTGLFILNVLYEQVIKNDILIDEQKFLLNFILNDNRVVGATFLDYNSSEVIEIYAKAVVVATGGLCSIYKINTNTNANFGDGIIATFKAGAKLSNMEFIQFHPTALKNSKMLISESVRGEGGLLVDKNKNQIADPMATRDELSREIFYKIKYEKKDIFLDLRDLGADKINRHFPREREMIIKYQGVDPVESLVQIAPSAHYTLGGIDVDINCKSSIDGLYAVGECSNIGAHGANRLGANSLLDSVVFATKATFSIKEYIKNSNPIKQNNKQQQKDSNYIDHIFKSHNKISFYDKKSKLSDLMYLNAGIIKKDTELNIVLKEIKEIKDKFALMGIDDKDKNFNQNLIDFLEFKNMLDLCEIIVLCSINRKESRGAHFRVEYKNMDDRFAYDSFVVNKNGVLRYGFKGK